MLTNLFLFYLFCSYSILKPLELRELIHQSPIMYYSRYLLITPRRLREKRHLLWYIKSISKGLTWRPNVQVKAKWCIWSTIKCFHRFFVSEKTWSCFKWTALVMDQCWSRDPPGIYSWTITLSDLYQRLIWWLNFKSKIVCGWRLSVLHCWEHQLNSKRF